MASKHDVDARLEPIERRLELIETQLEKIAAELEHLRGTANTDSLSE